MAFILLSCILRSIIQQNRKNELVLYNQKKHRKEIAIVKLITIIGVTDITGFVQVRISNLNVGEKHINLVFSVIYIICRGFKGLAFACIYLLTLENIQI